MARGVICLAGGALRVAAQDAALKITETTSVLAAAYTPEEFQSGWAAALSPGFTTFGYSEDRDDPGLPTLAGEVTRRGASWVEVSPHPDAAVRLPAGLPAWARPIVAVVRGQQLARTAALLSGRDPDQPSADGPAVGRPAPPASGPPAR
jgi:fructoselysine-6-P-deglycase FrlB-like protein